MRTAAPPVHVCSLSMSPLTEAQKDLAAITAKYEKLSPEQRDADEVLNCQINRARWVELAIEYNRNKQLQNVYKHLGDKATNPEFRNFKLRKVIKDWKRELLRSKWQEVAQVINLGKQEKKISEKKDVFTLQRAQLSAKAFATKLPIDQDIFVGILGANQSVEELFSFVTPEAMASTFRNAEELNFMASEACTDISTVPETQEEESNNPEFIEEMKRRIQKKQEEEQKIVEEEKAMQIEAEKSFRRRALNEEYAGRPQDEENTENKNEAQPPKSNNVIIIAVIAIIVLLIAAFIFFRTRSNATKLVCKATPTPKPKKGWF